MRSERKKGKVKKKEIDIPPTCYLIDTAANPSHNIKCIYYNVAKRRIRIPLHRISTAQIEIESDLILMLNQRWSVF